MGHKSQHFYRKEAKLENPEGEEGVQTRKKKTNNCGEGMDILWNNTLLQGLSS